MLILLEPYLHRLKKATSSRQIDAMKQAHNLYFVAGAIKQKRNKERRSSSRREVGKGHESQWIALKVKRSEWCIHRVGKMCVCCTECASLFTNRQRFHQSKCIFCVQISFIRLYDSFRWPPKWNWMKWIELNWVASDQDFYAMQACCAEKPKTIYIS